MGEKGQLVSSRISIILPTYNRADLISDTIESLLALKRLHSIEGFRAPVRLLARFPGLVRIGCLIDSEDDMALQRRPPTVSHATSTSKPESEQTAETVPQNNSSSSTGMSDVSIQDNDESSYKGEMVEVNNLPPDVANWFFRNFNEGFRD